MAAARMGADTFMVGKVGNDHNGRKITSELTNHGVSVMSVSLTARAATGVALIVCSQSEYFSIVDPSANQKMSPKNVSHQALNSPASFLRGMAASSPI